MKWFRIKWKWWALQNWFKGYQFSPVQRFRCCGHTTPYAHGRNCPASTRVDSLIH